VTGSQPLLDVRQLEVAYHVRGRSLLALRGVEFDIAAGEIFGVVGESGCGKSTLSAALIGLLPANGEITSGSIRLDGRELRGLGRRELRQLRGGQIAMVFQDPLTSLNPTIRIGTQLLDVQRAHLGGQRRRGDLRRRAVEMLTQVGIPDASERFGDYPHQFSGGMRQRIVIAMALLLRPSLLIADEPTSALDATLEAQMIELFKQLRHDFGTAIVFISHDLTVVSQVCDRMMVMYAGQAVEEGDVQSVFREPLHPYTKALLAAVPSRNQRGERLATIPGRVPSLSAPSDGCAFADRCTFVQPVNREREPHYVAWNGRRVRCNIYDPTSGYQSPPRREDVS
jgi:oligopeptide/dipeptide ABC transporter ATP-binding protein